MKDKHGNLVELGDVVRVLEIAQDFLDILPDDEKPHIMGMLNNEYEIDEFPEDGKVSVSMWWDLEDGSVGYGGLYMLSHEFELVKKAPTNETAYPIIQAGLLMEPLNLNVKTHGRIYGYLE